LDSGNVLTHSMLLMKYVPSKAQSGFILGKPVKTNWEILVLKFSWW
jgi:hypothetical protein